MKPSGIASPIKSVHPGNLTVMMLFPRFFRFDLIRRYRERVKWHWTIFADTFERCQHYQSHLLYLPFGVAAIAYRT